MTVWLIVFILADGEQAEAASYWQASKYECERLRHSLEPDARARGWSARCVAWDIPEDFSLPRPSGSGPVLAEEAPAGGAQVLRSLRELTSKTDALDGALGQVGTVAKNTEIAVRDIERTLKRLESTLHGLQSRPCYR